MWGHMLSYALGACVLAGAVPAAAQITKVLSSDALKSNTTVEWFEFGKDGGSLSTPVTRRFGALKVEVASSSGLLDIVREGTTWQGDFIAGQYLLRQPFQSDSLLVSFQPPVSAVGMQIDPGGQGQSGYTGRFTAVLCLYGGAQNSLLGMVATPASAGTGEDGSARYIGARSAGQPIHTVRVFVSGVDPNFPIDGNVTINRVEAVVPVGAPDAELAAAPVRAMPACPS